MLTDKLVLTWKIRHQFLSDLRGFCCFIVARTKLQCEINSDFAQLYESHSHFPPNWDWVLLLTKGTKMKICRSQLETYILQISNRFLFFEDLASNFMDVNSTASVFVKETSKDKTWMHARNFLSSLLTFLISSIFLFFSFLFVLFS